MNAARGLGGLHHLLLHDSLVNEGWEENEKKQETSFIPEVTKPGLTRMSRTVSRPVHADKKIAISVELMDDQGNSPFMLWRYSRSGARKTRTDQPLTVAYETRC